MSDRTDILRLEGALTIKTVTETRDRIIEAFKSARSNKSALEIEIGDDCDCDLTLPQLLMAAQKTAEIEGLGLRIRAPEQGAFANTLARAGLNGADGTGSVLRVNGDNR